MFNFNLEFTGELAAFFILSACAILGAVMSISFTKVVHMTLSLAFTFISLAGLYILLDAEYIAFVQVLLYVGAITILMIFGIMMTKHNDVQESPRPLLETLAALGCLSLFGILFYGIRNASFPAEKAAFVEDTTREIGMQLFTRYAIPFELLSVLLTVAFIGAVALAKKEEEPQ